MKLFSFLGKIFVFAIVLFCCAIIAKFIFIAVEWIFGIFISLKTAGVLIATILTILTVIVVVALIFLAWKLASYIYQNLF